MGGAGHRGGVEGGTGRDALVHHDRVLGQGGGDRLGRDPRADRAARRRRPFDCAGWRFLVRVERQGQLGQRVAAVLGRMAQDDHVRRLRNQPARTAFVAEEGDRIERTGQDHRVDAAEELHRLLREVGNPRQERQARAALHAPREGLGGEPAAGRQLDLGGLALRRARVAGTAQQHHRPLAPRDGRAGAFDGFRGDPGAERRRRLDDRAVGLAPLAVGRHDERGDLPGMLHGRRNGGGHVARDVLGRGDGALPVGDSVDQALDLRVERRVVVAVPGGVVADDVDERRPAAPGVVQVGDAVREPRAEVNQGQRRLARHPAVTVGGAGGDALELRQHAANAGDLVERGDEMDLGRAGIRETDLDAGVGGGPEHCLGAVHRSARVASRGRRRPGGLRGGSLRVEPGRGGRLAHGPAASAASPFSPSAS